MICARQFDITHFIHSLAVFEQHDSHVVDSARTYLVISVILIPGSSFGLLSHNFIISVLHPFVCYIGKISIYLFHSTPCGTPEAGLTVSKCFAKEMFVFSQCSN